MILHDCVPCKVKNAKPPSTFGFQPLNIFLGLQIDKNHPLISFKRCYRWCSVGCRWCSPLDIFRCLKSLPICLQPDINQQISRLQSKLFTADTLPPREGNAFFLETFFWLGMLQPLCLPMVPLGAERKVLGGLEMMWILKLFLSNPYNKYKGCITSSHYSPLSQAQWVPAFTCELWKMPKISLKNI